MTSIALQHIKGAEAIDQDRFKDVYFTFQMQWYTIAMMPLTLLGMIYMVSSKLRKSTLLREHLFSNVVNVRVFVLDAQSYVSVKLCKVAGSICLLKLMGKLTPGSIKLKRNCIWDVLDIDWKEVSMTLNGNKINCHPQLPFHLEINLELKGLLVKSPCSCM